MIRDFLRARTHRAIALTVATLGLAWSAEARAADEVADTLAGEAKMLMEQNRYKEACPKLADSHRRAPSGEKILDLARCHKEQGRLATAYYELREALDIAQRDGRRDRAKAAAAMLEEIEPKLPKISVSVSMRASSIPGFEVKRDGTPIRPSEWADSFPVDPGTHTIMATAPGRRPLLQKVEVSADGSTKQVVIFDLEGGEPARTTRLAPVAPRRANDDTASSWGVQRTAGLVFSGVGATALGLGTVLGVRAAAVQRDSDAHCRGSECTPEGRSMRDSAESLGTSATLSLIGGGVMTAGGLLLFFTAPSKTTTTGQGPALTTVSLGPTGGAVRGQW